MSLKPTEVAGLRDTMHKRSRALESEIAAKLRESVEDLEMLGRVGDSGDMAWVESESGLDLAEAQRDIQEWRGIREAIRRMDTGEYGVCVDCASDIPLERLRSQPLALRCIDCQVRRERLGALGVQPK